MSFFSTLVTILSTTLLHTICLASMDPIYSVLSVHISLIIWLFPALLSLLLSSAGMPPSTNLLMLTPFVPPRSQLVSILQFLSVTSVLCPPFYTFNCILSREYLADVPHHTSVDGHTSILSNCFRKHFSNSILRFNFSLCCPNLYRFIYSPSKRYSTTSITPPRCFL